MVTFNLSGITEKDCFVSIDLNDKKKYPWFEEAMMSNCFKDRDRVIFYLTRMVRQKINESILVKNESGDTVFYYEKL